MIRYLLLSYLLFSLQGCGALTEAFTGQTSRTCNASEASGICSEMTVELEGMTESCDTLNLDVPMEEGNVCPGDGQLEGYCFGSAGGETVSVFFYSDFFDDASAQDYCAGIVYEEEAGNEDSTIPFVWR